jgi:Gly-Xaa carboxypeptidase
MTVIGERVWGRGSQDDKSGLIGELFTNYTLPVCLIVIAQASCMVSLWHIEAQLTFCLRTAMESMLENKFQPTRTVVLASGFDEETSGLHVRTLWHRLS